jgi:hypothetical protein
MGYFRKQEMDRPLSSNNAETLCIMVMDGIAENGNYTKTVSILST